MPPPGLHGRWEADLDRLLRGERFVDLYGVTRQSLRASVERYTLKDMEVFHNFGRAVPLAEAGACLRRVSAALERSLADAIEAQDREAVAMYDRDDCLSAASLRDWLERLRAELVAGGVSPKRPEHSLGHASQRVREGSAAEQELYDALVVSLPPEREA